MAYHYEAEANYNIAKAWKLHDMQQDNKKTHWFMTIRFLENGEKAIERAIEWEPDKGDA